MELMFFYVLLQLLYCYSSAYQKTGFVLTLYKTHILKGDVLQHNVSSRTSSNKSESEYF